MSSGLWLLFCDWSWFSLVSGQSERLGGSLPPQMRSTRTARYGVAELVTLQAWVELHNLASLFLFSALLQVLLYWPLHSLALSCVNSCLLMSSQNLRNCAWLMRSCGGLCTWSTNSLSKSSQRKPVTSYNHVDSGCLHQVVWTWVRCSAKYFMNLIWSLTCTVFLLNIL